VRWIVGYPAGGSADMVARLIGKYLAEKLGQPFVIENRPGAGTNIATEAAVRAPADGYTLLLVNPANAINATLYDKLNFNFIVLPGYEANTWFGGGVPRNTPAEIVDKLNKEINAALADPKIKARLADLGGTALAGSPAEFGKLIAVETEKWGKVVKFSGAKPG